VLPAPPRVTGPLRLRVAYPAPTARIDARDSTFLYGATNHPSVFPALWMHPGLTIPPAGTPEFRAFDRQIALRIRENDVTYILQEGSRTRMDANLDDFPRVSALIAGCARATAGAWTIREICH